MNRGVLLDTAEECGTSCKSRDGVIICYVSEGETHVSPVVAMRS